MVRRRTYITVNISKPLCGLLAVAVKRAIITLRLPGIPRQVRFINLVNCETTVVLYSRLSHCCYGHVINVQMYFEDNSIAA